MASRKLRTSHKPTRIFSLILRSRLSVSVSSAILLILAAAATAVICYQSWYILLQTKTVAGDNLKATPWHIFKLPTPDKWSIAARFPKILKCNYLSCLTHNLLPDEPLEFLFNRTETCPRFFQWIYEDLAPWRRNKITLDSLRSAQKHAAFRVTIVGGHLYTVLYYACVQPRAMFTLWGLLQLLKRYPGMIPDVDLMFDCMDRPVIKKAEYEDKESPPPLFRYCGDKESYDIPFPDWSFWGWPQIDMLPWSEESESIFKASKILKWEKRNPNAYWKGNPDVGSRIREELLKCNSSHEKVLGAEIFRQDWVAEIKAGFRNSKLSEQCKHRFKIYAEGHAWSVSFKYIFSCDSPVLVASPTYHEFFSRSLIPMVHYWPIRQEQLCDSIKFAVHWGNDQPAKAKEIGKAGQNFMRRQLSMDHVYDYMFHLLKEYSKLQNFKPVPPSEAQILCQNSILCFADDEKSKDILSRSELEASVTPPCTLAPHDNLFIHEIDLQKENNTRQVWNLEDGWD